MPLRGVCTGGNDGITGTTAACTFTLPAGAVAGDLLVAETAQATGSNTCPTPTGAVLQHGPDTPSNSNRSYLFTKVLTSGDVSAGQVAFPWTSSGRTIGAAAVLYDVDPSQITVAEFDTSVTNDTFAVPALSTTVDNSEVLRFITTRVGSGAVPPDISSWGAAGYTTDKQAKMNTGAANLGASIGHQTTPNAAGPHGGGNITLSTSSTSTVVYILGVAPVATGPNTGTASGGFSFTGSAAGSKDQAGTAGGGFALAGSTSGSRSSQGSSSGTMAWAGSAAGSEAPSGSSSGSLAFAGSASGSRSPDGAAAGGLAWAGSSSGSKDPAGTASGVLKWAGTATGRAPVVGGASGFVSGRFKYRGSTATGSKHPRGSSSGHLTLTGAASGHERAHGATAGGYALAGQSSGSRGASGVLAGALTWHGLAHGRNLAGQDIIAVLGPSAVRTRTGPVAEWVTKTGPTAVRTRTGPDVT